MTKYLRLAWYWARSRYAPQNAFVRCETCPNWIFHSHVKTTRQPLGATAELFPPLDLDYRAGVCALDVPKVFNDFTTGFALKAWTGHDWCPRHPLYESNIVQGSHLQYRPGEDTLANAGFDRLPTFQEAVAMAMKDSKNESIIGQDAIQDKEQENGRSRIRTQDNNDTR